MTTILATLDGSPTSEAIIPVLAKLAGGMGARIRLLTVLPPPAATPKPSTGFREIAHETGGSLGVPLIDSNLLKPDEPTSEESTGQAIARVKAEGEEMLDNAGRPLRDAGLDVEVEVAIGDDPAKEIIDNALERHVDMIAMSTHGRSGVRRVIQGSVAAAVVSAGVLPVLLIRPTS